MDSTRGKDKTGSLVVCTDTKEVMLQAPYELQCEDDMVKEEITKNEQLLLSYC
jgi:hypothetical protein